VGSLRITGTDPDCESTCTVEFKLEEAYAGTVELSAYRFGFNGKEADTEWHTDVNYDYGFRIYDPRISRFLSVDPLTKDYPSWSPYPFAMNRVIDGIDLDGLEWTPVTSVQGEVTGFRFDPASIARNSDGSLRPNYFDAAIFFSDEGFKTENHNIGSSIATVFRPDGTTSTYLASTYPSNSSKYATIRAGLYQAVHTIHNKQFPALQLRRYHNIEDGNIPVIGINPANPWRDPPYADGINIHHNYTQDYSTAGNRSAGCQLICKNQWTEFIAEFDGVSSIAVYVYRNGQNPLYSNSNSSTLLTEKQHANVIHPVFIKALNPHNYYSSGSGLPVIENYQSPPPPDTNSNLERSQDIQTQTPLPAPKK